MNSNVLKYHELLFHIVSFQGLEKRMSLMEKEKPERYLDKIAELGLVEVLASKWLALALWSIFAFQWHTVE